MNNSIVENLYVFAWYKDPLGLNYNKTKQKIKLGRH